MKVIGRIPFIGEPHLSVVMVGPEEGHPYYGVFVECVSKNAPTAYYKGRLFYIAPTASKDEQKQVQAEATRIFLQRGVRLLAAVDGNLVMGPADDEQSD